MTRQTNAPPGAGPARPRVKVCGITEVEDAVAIADMGVRYLGLNFFPESPRFIDIESAVRIRRAVGESVVLVGVFVNADSDAVARTVDQVGLEVVQFHGDEAPEDVHRFGDKALWALRGALASDGAGSEWIEQSRGLYGLLVDRAHPTLYGGTGESWEYSKVADLARNVRLFVAGGISPTTARSALEQVPYAYALDTCSGVECSPGRKDLEAVQQVVDVVDAWSGGR